MQEHCEAHKLHYSTKIHRKAMDLKVHAHWYSVLVRSGKFAIVSQAAVIINAEIPFDSLWSTDC